MFVRRNKITSLPPDETKTDIWVPSPAQTAQLLKELAHTPKSLEMPDGTSAQVQVYEVNWNSEAQAWKAGIKFVTVQFNRHFPNLFYPEYKKNRTNISVEALGKAFPFDTSLKPKYVLDFGQGLIPIHVFDFQLSEQGIALARFVEMGDLIKAVHSTKGRTVLANTYNIRRDVLRYVGSSGDKEDKSTAYWNIFHEYQDRKHTQKLVLPKLLMTGKPVVLPTGETFEVTVGHLLTLPKVQSEESNIFEYMEEL